MVLVNNGESDIPLLYFGMNHCSNCERFTHFSVYQVEKKINRFLIPITNQKYGKYIVCEFCGACIEIDDKQFDEIKVQCNGLPNHEQFDEIYDSLETELKTAILNNAGNVALSDILDRLSMKFNEYDVEKVFYRYSRYLINILEKSLSRKLLL